MVRPMRLVLVIPLILSACASFPALDSTISDAARQALYPTLTPIPVVPSATADKQATLQARITDLQARAARIRQINIDALQ